MKNKIIMFALMCALLLTLVPTTNARADDVVDVESLCMEACLKLIENDEIMERIQTYRHYAVGYAYDSNRVEIIIYENTGSVPDSLMLKGTGVYLSQGSSICEGCLYYYADGVWNWQGRGSVNIGYNALTTAYIVASSFDCVYDENNVVYKNNIPAIDSVFGGEYTFSKWCADAGLNCSFADLEGNVIECRNTDILVVRQGAHVVGGNGYYLTQVNITEDSAIFPTLIDWHVGLATMSNDWLSYYVKQYVYDYYDGRWEMCDDVVTQEVKAGSPIPSVGCALSDSVGLVFSNRDLYASDYSVAFNKSDSFVNEPYYAPSVPQEPEVTPSPSPDIGYDVYVYRPSLVGKVGLNNSKIYELPSAGSEALGAFIEGWSLSIQGYCCDNDGMIWYLCSAVRDDITYTGYMPAKHVEIEPYNGIDVSFGDISVDDIPSVIESAKDGLLSALELVSVVPLMMGAVFGFLPSWCLLMVGVAFVLICFVGLIKVFRG